MEYLNKILKVPISLEAGDLLVESPAPNSLIDEKAIYSTFNNYDMALTITIKGSNNKRVEALKGNIYKQYQYIKDLLNQYVFTQISHYVVHFELHKCGEWLHAHALISIRTSNKTQQAKAIKTIRSSVFYAINNRKLKAGETYKNRILIEKVHTCQTWYDYIKKDEYIMNLYDNRITKLFKLIKYKDPQLNNVSI